MSAKQLVNEEIESFAVIRSQMLESYKDWKANETPRSRAAGEDGQFFCGEAPFVVSDGNRNYVVLTSDGGL